MAVQNSDIEDALGRTLTDAEQRQVPRWIGQAGRQIDARAARLGVAVDETLRDDVVELAVVAMVRRPTDEKRVRVTVDDGTTEREYSSSTGAVSILDDWWALLGLVERSTSGGWSGSVGYSR